MFRNLRPVLPLLLSTALLFASIGLLNTLLPLRGLRAGYPDTLTGGLTSAYYAGFLAGTFVMPLLVQRIGHIRAFAFGTACVASIVLLHAVGTWPWLWLALRFLDGIMMVGLYAIIESWLNAKAGHGKRGQVFAVYMMVNLVAMALSQQFLRLQGPPFMLFTVVALLTCVASLPVIVTLQRQPSHRRGPRLQLKRLYKLAPTAGVGALLSGLAIGAFYGMAPIYATRVGFDVTQVSTYMMLGILGGAALQWPLGHWSDNRDRRLALAAVSAIACLLGIAAWFAGGHAVAAGIIIFIYGGMAFAIYPIAVAHLVDYIETKELLAASTGVLLLYGAGSAAGPVIAGALMEAFGPAALPAWFALTHAVLAGYAIIHYRIVERETIRDNNFRPMLRTTVAALKTMPESRKHGTHPTTSQAESGS